MLPVTDFNFMVAGIATFAATVGYTYAARKLNTTTTEGGLSDDPTTTGTSDMMQMNTISDGGQAQSSGAPSRRESTNLKRKEPHDGFEDENTQDDGYPYNLANIYPRKRCRTPTRIKEVLNITSPPVSVPSDLEVAKKSEGGSTSGGSPTQEDWVFIPPFNSPNALPVEPPRTPTPDPETLIAPTPPQEVISGPQIPPVPAPTAEPQLGSLKSASVLAEPKLPKESTTVKGSDHNSTSSNHSLPHTEINSAGAKSPSEVAEAKSKDTENVIVKSPFTSVAVPSPSRSVPSSSAFKSRGFAEFAGTKSAFGVFNATQSVTHKSNQSIWAIPSANQIKENDLSNSTSNALSQATPSSKATITQLTGEEEEEIEMELKGVKLYVKRGDKPFAEGITGHVKLLSHKTTLDERLLFRREPLWKVSMNVRVSSSVRCTYDPSENVLRLIVSEHSDSTVTVEGQESPVEIVLYAMKPGRSCSKQDFKEFAETLIKNSHLKKPLSA